MKAFCIFVCFTLLAYTAKAVDFNRYAFTLGLHDGTTIRTSGTGCLVKHGRATYYVSARHALKDVDDKMLASSLKAMTIVNNSDHKIRIKPEAIVPVTFVEEDHRTDFIVLRIKSLPSLNKYTLKLATAAPQQGDTVYLAAPLPDRELATYPLKVLEMTDEIAGYEKIPGVTKYTGASGGPIINAQGELVGTYLGRRHKLDEQQTILSLYGSPFSALKKILESEATKSGPASSEMEAKGTLGKANPSARQWKSKTGQFSVTATLVSFDGKVVQLKTAEERTVNVPLEKLSAEDQEFLRGQAEKK